MSTIRFDLNEEYLKKLEAAAAEKNLSIQDYVRWKLFDTDTIFTIDEALKRIRRLEPGSEFTLPDIYGDDWTLKRGPAGVFGRNFFKYISTHQEERITYKDNGKYGRIATYVFEGRREHV
ncbi:MAG: DUF1413 domain-containing protein [Clostridiales bacterium]|nr:DUF1413 domain-containing protein [Clostridiales bacterium]